MEDDEIYEIYEVPPILMQLHKAQIVEYHELDASLAKQVQQYKDEIEECQANLKREVQSFGKRGSKALHKAARQGETAMVKQFLIAGCLHEYTMDQYSPLAIACWNGHTETVRCFIEQGVDVNYLNEKEKDHVTFSPLALACRNGHASIVKLLIDAGAVMTRKDTAGRTCLMVAVFFESLEVVKVLLDTPGGAALVNVGDKDGQTPLMVAKTQPMVKILLEGGASVTCVDGRGDTPLHCSVVLPSSSAVICTLIAAGADVLAVNKAQLTPADVAMRKGNTLAETLLRRLETSGNRARDSVPVVQSVSVVSEDAKVEEDYDAQQLSKSEESRMRVSVPVGPVQHNPNPNPRDSVPVVQSVSVASEDAKVEEDYDAFELSEIAADWAAELGDTETEEFFHSLELEPSAKEDTVDAANTQSLEASTQNDTVPSDSINDNVREKKLKKKLRPCAHCGEVTHRRCSGCIVTFYCSRTCQKASYAVHKIECPQIRDAGVDD